jgi:CBS-domain-containing membrane protein
MRHPKRAITPDIRSRRAKRSGREQDDLEAQTWRDGLRVSQLMTRGPATIQEAATIGAAWKLMRARKIRHLPVLDASGRLVGVVTDRDLRQVIFDPDIQAQLGTSQKAHDSLCYLAAPAAPIAPEAAKTLSGVEKALIKYRTLVEAIP